MNFETFLFLCVGLAGISADGVQIIENDRLLGNLDSLDRSKRDVFKRDVVNTLAEVGREFLNRGELTETFENGSFGGVQAIQELMTSEDKVGVLRRVLGNQVAGAVLGQGLLGRLVQGYTGTGGGYAPGGYAPGGYGGGHPAPSGPPLTPTGNGRWEPAGSPAATGGNRPAPAPSAPGGAAPNPDDTEY